MLTLGLVEAWYDAQTGLYLNAPPSLWSVRREPHRFSVHVTSYTENVAMLHEIVGLLKRVRHRPAARASGVRRQSSASNPDVRDAIAAGTLRTGYEHWLAHGRAEGTALRPDDIGPYLPED